MLIVYIRDGDRIEIDTGDRDRIRERTNRKRQRQKYIQIEKCWLMPQLHIHSKNAQNVDRCPFSFLSVSMPQFLFQIQKRDIERETIQREREKTIHREIEIELERERDRDRSIYKLKNAENVN